MPSVVILPNVNLKSSEYELPSLLGTEADAEAETGAPLVNITNQHIYNPSNNYSSMAFNAYNPYESNGFKSMPIRRSRLFKRPQR